MSIPEHLGRGEALPPPQPPAAVAAFEDRLAQHRARFTGDMPDTAAILDHEGRLPSEQQADRFFHGVHFTQEVTKPFRERGERGPENISFTHIELLEMGHEESYHGTFAGRLNMESADGTVVTERLVAVKPFYLHEGGSAVQELAMLQHVRKLGFETVRPLGLIMDRWAQPPRLFLITEYAGELSTMAAENWRGVSREDVAERVKPAVDTVLALNEKGAVHGDPQFKNIATGESTDSQIIHDLEEARSIVRLLESAGPDDPVPPELVRLLRHEFWRMRLSMRKYVYPNLPADQQPQTAEERFMLELNVLFEPYHIGLSRSGTPHKDALNRTYHAVLEQTRGEVREGKEPNLLENEIREQRADGTPS